MGFVTTGRLLAAILRASRWSVFCWRGGKHMAPSPDQRSPMAIAADWSGRIISISLEMVLPGVAGMWIDNKLGTRVVFTLAGFALGMTGAIWQLARLTSVAGKFEKDRGQDDGKSI